MSSKSNKKYWDNWNIKYSQVWLPLARQEMSKRETNFITSRLSRHRDLKILDIGIGNGRILNVLNQRSSSGSRIFGIDISTKMIKICQSRFENDPKISHLKVSDLSTETIPFKTKFDFITMIRVLKYNANWQIMIKKVYDQLSRGGMFIFTMPNAQSISAFSGDKFSDKNSPIIYSTISEIEKVCFKAGFTHVEIVSFSKLPNFLYHITDNRYFVKTLITMEIFLESLLGKSLFGRELFVVCTK